MLVEYLYTHIGLYPWEIEAATAKFAREAQFAKPKEPA